MVARLELLPGTVPGISHALAYALGLASVLLLFVSILLHEIGDAVVARRHGVEVEEIDLWLLGGVARMRGEAREPGAELRYAIAGPAVTAMIAVFFGVLMLLLPASSPQSARVFVEYQLLINVFLLVFNLLPAFPLDGGRVFRAVLWARMHDMQRATNVAAGVGRAFGYLIGGIGLVLLPAATRTTACGSCSSASSSPPPPASRPPGRRSARSSRASTPPT